MLFSNILETKDIPDIFKAGVLTPIHKKGKDARMVENYRGITVTSVLGKLFETAVLQRLNTLNENQSQMQYGFTKGLSPSMAALLLSEATSEAQLMGNTLYVATLDSQKAFDVVNHQILMKKLYEQGIGCHLWTIISSMYKGLTAKVKWEGDISDSFNICQGVRQGGILSTHLYKAYVNDLLLELEEQDLGMNIGPVYSGCPTCADDILLITSEPNELQLMLSLAFTYSQEHRYHIHPQKSAVIKKNVSKPAKANDTQDVDTNWKLGNTDMPARETTTHLGLTRAATGETNINISDRISLARRTLYALMRTGVHGTNGINPKIAYRIYQVYVLPRLLYNLEVLPLNITQIKKLEHFHIDTLKKLQSLPQRTANSAVLLMLGALPVEAELHKRQLSLLQSIVNSKNSTMKELLSRQANINNQNSFFSKVERTLAQYELPTLKEVSNSKYTKLRWKHISKAAIESYWTEELLIDAEGKSTLINCNINSMRIGKTHMVWDSVMSNTTDVKRGIIKARMLTGTYTLQSNKAKFNKYEINATCPLCRLEAEDITHMITRCTALHNSRLVNIKNIQQYITEKFGEEGWTSVSSRRDLTTLIIDCGMTKQQGTLPLTTDDRKEIESISRRLCYRLHVNRLQKHKQLNI